MECDQTLSAIHRGRWSGSLPVRSRRQLLLGLALAGSIGLAALTFLFLARRLSGGLHEPLSAPMAAMFSLALAAGAVMVRVAGMLSWWHSPRRLDRRLAWMLFVLPGLACFVVALAVTVPVASAAADTWLFVPLLLVEVVSLAAGAWMIRHADRAQAWFLPIGQSAQQPVCPTQAPADPRRTDGPLPADVMQRLVRRRLPEGQEAFQGRLRVGFAAGQRTDVLHVAFCPPFETTPQWTATVVEGAALTIKQVQVYPYGARLEVRLNQSSSRPMQSVIAFQAVEVRDHKPPE